MPIITTEYIEVVDEIIRLKNEEATAKAKFQTAMDAYMKARCATSDAEKVLIALAEAE